MSDERQHHLRSRLKQVLMNNWNYTDTQCLKSVYGIEQLDIRSYNAFLASSFTESSNHVSLTDFTAALDFKAYILLRFIFDVPESQTA